MVPKPPDWGRHIDVCGYFTLRESQLSGWQPPQDLVDFLAAGRCSTDELLPCLALRCLALPEQCRKNERQTVLLAVFNHAMQRWQHPETPLMNDSTLSSCSSWRGCCRCCLFVNKPTSHMLQGRRRRT